MIKILIADDHRLVIDGLLLMLREAEDMLVRWRSRQWPRSVGFARRGSH